MIDKIDRTVESMEQTANSKKQTVSKKPENEQPSKPKGGESKEYQKKGMERLIGDKNIVETSIMVKTKDGWEHVKLNRKRITY